MMSRHLLLALLVVACAGPVLPARAQEPERPDAPAAEEPADEEAPDGDAEADGNEEAAEAGELDIDISTAEAAFETYTTLLAREEWDTLFDYLSEGSLREIGQVRAELVQALEAGGERPPSEHVQGMVEATGAETPEAMESVPERVLFAAYMSFMVEFLGDLEEELGHAVPGPHRAADMEFVRAENRGEGRFAAFYVIRTQAFDGVIDPPEHDLSLHRSDRGFLFGP